MNKREIFDRVIFRGPFSDKDYKALSDEEKSYLIKTPAGYLPSSADELYDYGCSLRMQRNFFSATNAYVLCTQIDPNHYDSNITLAIDDIHLKKYEDFLSHIKFLRVSKDLGKIHDYNFYLLLLSYLYELDDETRRVIAGFRFFDISVPPNDKRYDYKSQNEFRKKIFDQRFNPASTDFRKIIAAKPHAKENKLVEKLLKSITNYYKSRFARLRDYIYSSDYAALISYLEVQSSKMPLIPVEKKILTLAHDILTMHKTEQPVLPKVKRAFNELKMIELAQYERVYISNLIFAHKNNIAPSCDIMSKILFEAIYTKEQYSRAGEDSSVESTNIDYIKEIYTHLLSRKYDDAFTLLNSYLLSRGLEKYEYYIKTLMELDISRNSSDFVLSMHELGKILVGFPIKIDYCLELCEEALKSAEIEEAKKLLELIDKLIADGLVKGIPAYLPLQLAELRDQLNRISINTIPTSSYVISPTDQ